MLSGSIGRFAGYRYCPPMAISVKTTRIAHDTMRPGVFTNSRQRLAVCWRDRRMARCSCSGVSAAVVVIGLAPADPRVDERITKVCQLVGDDDRDDYQQERAVQDWVVLGSDAADHELTQARIVEYVLDEDRPAEQQAERDRQDREQRQHRVAGDVPGHGERPQAAQFRGEA